MIVWQGGVSGDLAEEYESATDKAVTCIRISAQLYNQEADYQHLIDCIKRLI